MATILEKRLAEEIVKNAKRKKPKNKKQLLIAAGYSPVTASASATRTIEQRTVQEQLEEWGFTSKNAKRVVGQILNKRTAKDADRLKAAEQVFKVEGDYAPEKNITLEQKIIRLDM